MKVSLKWLQTYFDAPLPPAEKIADAYTFHAFEIDEMEGDMLDIKVLPNRAADCLSHRGLAKELSAILDMPLSSDPLRAPNEIGGLRNPLVRVEIEDPKKCSRYIGALVKGVTVGPSPAWLREALESVGQRSINNVVDATNYVMLNVGQPLHAFDAAKLEKDGAFAIGVRAAEEGEAITTLSNDEYALTPAITLITDASTGTPLALAGIKGGKHAEVTSATTDLIIESANFDGTTTRRAAQTLKLFTDASLRFQNRPSPELAAYGMRDVLALITEIAGGKAEAITDEYPNPAPAAKAVTVSIERINQLLGSTFTHADVEGVCRRLGLAAAASGEIFTITPPFERTDIAIPEDIAEEVGRTLGYDKVPAVELPALPDTPDQARYHGIERMKDQLVTEGFIEVSTQSFAKKGDIELANPLDKKMPALRTTLEANLAEALTRANYVAPRVLPPGQKPRLFEVGTVFPKEGEYLELRMTEKVPEWGEMTVDNLSVAKLEDYGKDYTPVRYALGAFTPFSAYPFITRDIALWVPAGTAAATVEGLIRAKAGSLLVRLDKFDEFEKDGRVSYAFRLVFESMERTLTDEEANGIMDTVALALRGEGYEVR